jgi:hypothetical protein
LRSVILLILLLLPFFELGRIDVVAISSPEKKGNIESDKKPFVGGFMKNNTSMRRMLLHQMLRAVGKRGHQRLEVHYHPKVAQGAVHLRAVGVVHLKVEVHIPTVH